MTTLDVEGLVQAHAPHYFFDYKETEVPVNLSTYVKKNTVVNDNTISAVYRPAAGEGDGGYIHYFLFFMIDAGMSVFGLRNLGSHAYDIEQLVLKVDARGTVEGIDFKPHNSSEHFRITDALDIKQILKDGHPQVYVSRGKHACYPVPGTVTRYLGVVSDVCEHPVKQDLTAIVLDEAVINVRYIGKGFPGIKKRLVPNPSVPRIRLNEVRLHNALPLFR